VAKDLLPLREGLPFILPLAGGGVLFGLRGELLLCLSFSILAFMALIFFRNPSRNPPQVEGTILAPADGRVIRVEEAPLPGGQQKGKKVSIFMSVWDVHVNRSPVEGVVERREYKRGRFLPAFKGEASQQNEQNLLLLRTKGGEHLAVVQVAGIIARRILCRAKLGQRFSRGEVFGAILLGSRVDLYLPQGVEVSVREGDRVRAGESIIGFMEGA